MERVIEKFKGYGQVKKQIGVREMFGAGFGIRRSAVPLSVRCRRFPITPSDFLRRFEIKRDPVF